jgi:hypothetical protein
MTETPNPIRLAAAALNQDVFLYNGPISRQQDHSCIDGVGVSQRHAHATLILVTQGGDPDAAFKMARHLQEQYDYLTVLVSGLCKSAGTLLAIGAHELAFAPYGELGPLDIQMNKVDRFDSAQSGLVISESLATLEERAVAVFNQTSADLIRNSGGLISFATASDAAVQVMKAIYEPVLSRIDPEDIGVRARAMRIAQDYGSRLATISRNLKPDTLTLLSEKYPSHSFVIDRIEAEGLFERVRSANAAELALLALLGRSARFPSGEVSFHALHDIQVQEANDDEAQPGGHPPEDGGNPEAADGAPVAAAAIGAAE